MAIITDYATLITAIQDYLNRSDLSTFAPNFLQGAEGKLYKNLRIRAMENALSVTTSSGVAALPTSPAFLELKYAYVNQSPVVPLTKVAPEQIYQKFPNRTAGEVPFYIAEEATNFIFGPYPQDGLTIKGIYYARLTSLGSGNTTNWFTSNAPDLLLYGSLLEAEPFLVGDERMVMWNELYTRAFNAVKDEETRRKSGGGKLNTRVA